MDSKQLARRIAEEATYLIEQSLTPDRIPAVALVLGTGWGGAMELEMSKGLELENIRGFENLKHLPRIEGHERVVVCGDIGGKRVIALRGRIHLNEDSTHQAEVGGMVLQLPLPKRFDRDGAVRLIDERKDVDGLNFPGLVLPPAVSVVQKILKEAEVRHLDGKRVAIIGRGFLVGRPVAEWLTGRVKKLTVFHRGFFPKPLLKEADIVISGIGRPRYIRSAWIKRNAVLIDFGYARTNGRITGDFDLEPCEKKAAFITPTPGGTGPILVAQLFENFFKLVRMQK